MIKDFKTAIAEYTAKHGAFLGMRPSVTHKSHTVKPALEGLLEEVTFMLRWAG